LKQKYAGLSAAGLDVKINRQSKAIANGDGIPLLRRLELLEKQVEKRVEKTEKRLAKIEHRMQRATLNQWSEFGDPDLTAMFVFIAEIASTQPRLK
jgi:hypothetical protein